jgi:diguanylate cyclase (GGDEF)-like protein
VNRIGLEATLHEWWEAGRPRSRPMSAAMLDLDRFERINDLHGSLVGDKILNRVAELIREQCGSGDLPARFTGQRFFVMMCDMGPRAAAKKIELIRQGIEKAVFLRDTEEIRLTACGALTEVKPDDTEHSVFERLGEAVRHAKHAGPNQMFVDDGKTLERIESPNLGAKYTEFEV